MCWWRRSASTEPAKTRAGGGLGGDGKCRHGQLLADLVERGLQPDIAHLFIVDGAKALSRAVRDTLALR
jgi:hypothetical protein